MIMLNQNKPEPRLWQMVQGKGRSGSVKDDAPATRMEKVLRRALLLNPP